MIAVGMESCASSLGGVPFPILAAYFTHRNWEVTISPSNYAAGAEGNVYAKETPFVKTALAVLVDDSLSVETRRRLRRQSNYVKTKAHSVYATWDETTPLLTPKLKRDLLVQWGR